MAGFWKFLSAISEKLMPTTTNSVMLSQTEQICEAKGSRFDEYARKLREEIVRALTETEGLWVARTERRHA